MHAHMHAHIHTHTHTKKDDEKNITTQQSELYLYFDLFKKGKEKK